jgi:hypothetical protein
VCSSDLFVLEDRSTIFVIIGRISYNLTFTSPSAPVATWRLRTRVPLLLNNGMILVSWPLYASDYIDLLMRCEICVRFSETNSSEAVSILASNRLNLKTSYYFAETIKRNELFWNWIRMLQFVRRRMIKFSGNQQQLVSNSSSIKCII